MCIAAYVLTVLSSRCPIEWLPARLRTVHAPLHTLHFAGEWAIINQHAEYICDHFLTHVGVVQSGVQVPLPLPPAVLDTQLATSAPAGGRALPTADDSKPINDDQRCDFIHTDGVGSAYVFGTVDCGAGGVFRLVPDTELHVGVRPPQSGHNTSGTGKHSPPVAAASSSSESAPHQTAASPPPSSAPAPLTPAQRGSGQSAEVSSDVKSALKWSVACPVFMGSTSAVRLADTQQTCLLARCWPAAPPDTAQAGPSACAAPAPAVGSAEFMLLRFETFSLTLPLGSPPPPGHVAPPFRVHLPLPAVRGALLSAASDGNTAALPSMRPQGVSFIRNVHMPPSSMLAVRQIVDGEQHSATAIWSRRDVARAAHTLMQSWDRESIVCAAVSKCVFLVQHPTHGCECALVQVLCSEPPEAGAAHKLPMVVSASKPLASLAVGRALSVPSSLMQQMSLSQLGPLSHGNVLSMSRGVSPATFEGVMHSAAGVLQQLDEGGQGGGAPPVVHITPHTEASSGDTRHAALLLSLVLALCSQTARRSGRRTLLSGLDASDPPAAIELTHLLEAEHLRSDAGSLSPAHSGRGTSAGQIEVWGADVMDAAAASDTVSAVSTSAPQAEDGDNLGNSDHAALVVLRSELLLAAEDADAHLQAAAQPTASQVQEQLLQAVQARAAARHIIARAAQCAALAIVCVHDTPLSPGRPAPVWAAGSHRPPLHFVAESDPEGRNESTVEPADGGLQEDAMRQDQLVAIAAASQTCLEQLGETPPSHAFDELFPEVGGLWSAKQQLYESLLLPIRWPRLLRGGASLPRGVLLHGPSGVGKSKLATALGKAAGLPVVEVACSSLLDKYVGGSEAAVRRVWSQAQAKAPCILVLDAIDAIAPQRGGGGADAGTGVTDRMVNQLLTLLDGVDSNTGVQRANGGSGADLLRRRVAAYRDAVRGVFSSLGETDTCEVSDAAVRDTNTPDDEVSVLRDVFVVAVTSRPDIVDAALKRPGRLERHIALPPPSAAERCDIMRCCLQAAVRQGGCDGFDPAAVSAALHWAGGDQSTGATGADIQGVITSACLLTQEQQQGAAAAAEAALESQQAGAAVTVVQLPAVQAALRGAQSPSRGAQSQPQQAVAPGRRLGSGPSGNTGRAHGTSRSAVVLG